ncbi:MAG TPA: NADH-quinone oxidoreductase subunit N [Gemmataceae bacterium]|nr:NADH-quinone oxidoreductase subunit N [Gemmataceae bacterium]
MTVDPTLQQVFRLAVPEAALVGCACVLYVVSTLRAASRTAAGVLALAGLGLAAALHFAAPAPDGLVPTVSPLLPTHLATFVRLTALATGALLVLSCWNECDDRRAADFHASLLVAVAGFSLVGSANDLVTLFLALELISIPTYVMLYLPRGAEAQAQESAVKYFMLSVLSSALLLFGFSYLYGLTGTTNLTAAAEILPRLLPGDAATSALIATVMILAGLGFRVTAFPFHFYAPDVYQGGPTGTVAFLAFVPKVAGFAALLKLLTFVGDAHPVAGDFVKRVLMLTWILAAVTMTAGNVMGLLQDNLRRMLAYSSVANAGYMLIGLAVVPAEAYRSSTDAAVTGGAEALLFYLIAYGAMTVGAFAVLASLDSPARRVETVNDVAGLRETHPLSAFLLGLFLISMIGLPLTAGFVGKLLLFLSALAAPEGAPLRQVLRILAVVGAVNAAVGAYYYLRVVIALFLRSSLTPPQPAVGRSPLLLTAGVCAIVTVAFGVYPWPLLSACRWAANGY